MAAPPRPVAPHVNPAFFPDMQSGTTSVVRLLYVCVRVCVFVHLFVCVCACMHRMACVKIYVASYISTSIVSIYNNFPTCVQVELFAQAAARYAHY